MSPLLSPEMWNTPTYEPQLPPMANHGSVEGRGASAVHCVPPPWYMASAHELLNPERAVDTLTQKIWILK